MIFHYHLLGTTESRGHHSFTSLKKTNFFVFQETFLVTLLSTLHFEGFVLQLKVMFIIRIIIH